MDSEPHQPPQSDPTSVLERLGTALRDARIGRGLERADLAARLNMGDEQLRALENAELDRLPEPVFVIAQSRRVADALGLDISLLIAPLKQTGSATAPARVPMSPIPTAASPRRRQSRRGRGTAVKPVLATLALLCGLGAAGTWAWPQLQSTLKALPTISAAALNAKPPRAAEPPKPVKPKPAKAAAAPGVLTLRSAKPSWLEVRNQSDAVLFKGTFSGERQFPIGQGLKVLAGRPDLVQVSLVGRATGPLGPIDQIRWETFRPTQVRAKAPTP